MRGLLRARFSVVPQSWSTLTDESEVSASLRADVGSPASGQYGLPTVTLGGFPLDGQHLTPWARWYLASQNVSPGVASSVLSLPNVDQTHWTGKPITITSNE